MPLLIAHRANLNGPNPNLENTISYIQEALDAGYHVEIDLRVIDGKYFLGHDTPDVEVTREYLNNPRFWIHCKNSEALFEMVKAGLRCFTHDVDPYTITSKGEIWANVGQPVDENTICVMPERCPEQSEWIHARGVCTDYVTKYRDLYNSITK